MATIYLRSTDGNNADNGSTWALAKATLAAALTAAGAGGTVYMSQAHAETQAIHMTLTSPGTAGSPVRVICCNDGAEPPTATATTGSVSTTTGRNITFSGVAYYYGVGFSAGSGLASAQIYFTNGAALWLRFDTCRLALGGTSGGRFYVGETGSTRETLIEFVETILKFSMTPQGIIASCPFVWRGGSVDPTGTIPTELFKENAAGNIAFVQLEGVDLSALGSGKTLVAQPSTSNGGFFRFTNCKLHASVAISSGTIAGQGGAVIDLVNCDSGDTNYKYSKKVYQGDITQETTIKRTGGASDGVTGFSRKFVSTANAKFYAPLVGPWFKFWHSTLSSITVAIEIVTDNVTLTDAEAWVEVLHQGTSGYPLGVFENDRTADILATGANQTSSSETWTTTGLTTPVKQTLSKAVTPAEIGWVYARVVLAKSSTTLYACPKILGTSTYQYMEEDGSIVNGPTVSAGGGLIGGGNLSGGFL